jgi:O-methyltransferase domain
MKVKSHELPGTTEKPVTQQVQDLMTARWVADMIGVAAQLELADFIDRGAKTAEEIAKAKGLHATSLYRLLRGLASYGIFAEQEDGTFAQTPKSDALRKDVRYSAWGIAQLTTRPWAVRTWSELGHSIRVGTPAFEHVNGIQLFEYFNKHPNELELFAEAMRSFSVATGTAMAETFDFSGIRTLADIGGSQGFVLSLVLRKYRNMRGILFDLPAVVKGAPSFIKSYGLESRIEVRSGDFFESIPNGADAYLLKHILHDWSDEDCLRILTNIYAVAEPGTKLLVVDAVIGARNEHEFAKILDIQMLVHLRGKERTHAEWKELLHAAGFQLTRVVPTPSFAHVIEAVRIKYRAG